MQKYNNADVCKLSYSFLIFRGMSNKSEVSQVFSAYLIAMLIILWFLYTATVIV